MTPIRDYGGLRQWLVVGHVAPSEIVVIDGGLGSGKTHLARRLAKDVGGIRVSADCYLRAGSSGPYVKRIDVAFFTDDLMRLSTKFSVMVIEGICIRKLLSECGFTWHRSIYVKALAKSGIWNFELDLEDFASKSVADDDLAQSDFEYHVDFSPHTNSDVVFERTAD